MKKALTILLAALAAVSLKAQTDTTWINPPAGVLAVSEKSAGRDTSAVDTLAEPPTIADLPNEFLVLDTVPAPQRYFSRHMFGARYYFGLTKVSANPTIGEKTMSQPVNFGITYTYYHPLWDYINVFGLQMEADYCQIGYDSEYGGWGERLTEIQLKMAAQIHVDVNQFGRIIATVGPFYGYKLKTDKEGGFDDNDIRHDYGVYVGGGFAFVLGDLELHLEGGYQFSLCSLYHTYKYSDIYWLNAYPRNISISLAVHYNLW